MSAASKRFWKDLDRYHNLQRMYDRHTEITHPDFITSKRWLPECLSWGDYVKTNVKYMEYRGPQI